MFSNVKVWHSFGDYFNFVWTLLFGVFLLWNCALIFSMFTGNLNCAAFMAGIVEAFLSASEFVSYSYEWYLLIEEPRSIRYLLLIYVYGWLRDIKGHSHSPWPQKNVHNFTAIILPATFLCNYPSRSFMRMLNFSFIICIVTV